MIHPNLNNIQELTFSPLFQKTRERITMWRYRTITPIGKVQVINSLVSLQFVYKFMCLPSPSSKFFSEYKEIISLLFWEWGASLIHYNKIIEDYDKGALKLVDLPSKNQL